jgi:hypothetical protein
MIINPYAFGQSYDPDAQAFFTASGLTGATNLTAINQLVVDLKGYGIWTKMKAIYPMIGGTAALHKWNLKDPQDTNAAFRLVFNGGWTHSANGALPNGTNGWANTFLSPSTSLTNNNTHISYYSRTIAAGPTKGLIGASFGGSFIPLYTIYGRSTSGNQVQVDCYDYNTNRINIIDSTGAAFYTNNRTTSAFFRLFRNGLIAGTNSNANAQNVTSINVAFSLAAINLNGSVSQYGFFECAFSSIGDGLTDTEAANFYTAVQAYNTTLSRQV